MVKHYLTVAWRTFSRSKAYSLINLFGLTLGISCSSLIFLFVYDELTFDHHHQQIENIYRLNGGWRSMHDNTSQMYTTVGYNEGEILKRDFPEVDEVVRIRRAWDARIEKPQSDEYFTEFVLLTEPNIFNVFDIPFISGDPKTCLADHNSILITEKSAMKYFGSTDVLGKTLRWLGQDTTELKVTGVIKDYPRNTHLKFDFLVALKPPTNIREQWFEYGYYTFFTLQPNIGIEKVESRIQHFTKNDVQDVEKEIGFIAEQSIIPFADIHLHSDLQGELEANFKASYVYTFLIVGIFIMVMACINFMNLSTARSMTRAKEIGVRKVIGAIKFQLIRQFLGEAFVMTFVSAAISLVIVYLALPFVNDFTGKELSFINQSHYWYMLGAAVVIITLLAGFYPAFLLSAFRPIDTLKGSFKTSNQGIFLRKTLVIFQFTISIALIAGLLIIWSHISFMQNKELGFTKDQIMTVNGATPVMREQLLAVAGIESVSFSNRVPGYSLGGRTLIKGWNKSDPQVVIGQVVVDYDFIDLYELELKAGRGFSREIPSDENEAFLVNEAGMNLLGFNNAEDAIGQELWLDGDWGGKKGRIVGVIKDFHFRGVNATIEPFSMFLHPSATRFLSIKISSDKLQQVIAQVEEIFKKNVEGRAFQYSFIDQEFGKQYQAEEKFMTVFTVFSSLAIAIACLGLYGLASFMAEQRKKEVGVRKVLGASVANILSLLSGDFIKLVCIAFVVAVPLSYYGMEKWLDTFPYKEEINLLIFLFTGIAMLIMTMLVISYRAISAARMNPVKTLRSE